MLFIDLNGFKPINDRYGHNVGDSLLAGVGERLRAIGRSRDAVGRFGEDEFLVLCPGLTDAGQARAIARKIQERSGEFLRAGGRSPRSVGSRHVDRGEQRAGAASAGPATGPE